MWPLSHKDSQETHEDFPFSFSVPPFFFFLLKKIELAETLSAWTERDRDSTNEKGPLGA